MTHVDGNVFAGPIGDFFAFEATAARGRCLACHDVAALAEARVYGLPMGFVARCRNCDNVLIVIAQPGDRRYLDMSGLRWMRIDQDGIGTAVATTPVPDATFVGRASASP